MCKLFFFVKDFSGTTEPTILKFGTNVGYNLLYCVKENQPPPCLTFPLFVQFSFAPIKISVTDFSASMRAKVFKFCKILESGQVYCGKENQDAEFNFPLFLPVLLFFLSHSIVIHREICVKDFSGTIASRIWKFDTNVGYDLLHCVRENQPPDAYHFLYLSIFLSLQSNFLLPISRLLWEPVSSNFLYTLRVTIYCGTENQDAVIFPSFHLSLQSNYCA